MQRCPNCNARTDGSSHCRRCGMALDLLRRVEDAAERLTQQALRQLTNEQIAAAKKTLLRARLLHQQPLTEHLLGFIRHNEAQARATLARRHRILDTNPWD